MSTGTASASVRFRGDVWLLGWILTVTLAIILFILVGRAVSESHLRTSAERSAVHYAELIGASVVDLQALLDGGPPSPQTLSQLERLRGVGSVFRFKLFGPDGLLLLVSDQLDMPDFGSNGAYLGSDHGTFKSEAAGVIQSGQPFIELKDGRGKPDRPDTYSEAYVPIVIDDLHRGVVEVYVDQTALARENFEVQVRTCIAVIFVLLLLSAFSAMQRRTECRVRYLARHDVLSGALNRASFDGVLKTAAQEHAANGTTFAVHCVDLDRFKEVNDSLGHAAGDEVLCQATARLRELLLPDDHLARLGGDEFAVLQSAATDADAVETLAARICRSLSEPYETSGRQVSCGASVGVAVFGQDASALSELMHKADLALYCAKAAGRGQYSFYNPGIDARSRRKRELAVELRSAIEQAELTLAYQEIFASDGVTVVAAEALLRWRRPTGEEIPPGIFIPLAEEGGKLGQLGDWVLQQACHAAAAWPDQRRVAVNVAAVQFSHGRLAETVQAALDSSGLAPERLELEVAESLCTADSPQVLESLQVLRELGVRLVLDNFGTGNSSLAYLSRFNFDKLKIDRSFIQLIDSNSSVSIIIATIVSLAHSLRIDVNCVGIEDAGQLHQLQQLGCQEFQGYFLGRPGSAGCLRFNDMLTGSDHAVRGWPQYGQGSAS